MLSQLTSTVWGQAALSTALFVALALLWLAITRIARSWVEKHVRQIAVEGIRSLPGRYLGLLRLWGLLAGAVLAIELGGAMPSHLLAPLSKSLFGLLVAVLGGAATEGVTRIVGHSLGTAGTPRSLVRFSQAIALLSFSYLTLLILLAVVNISLAPMAAVGVLAAIPLLLVFQDAASNIFFYLRLMRQQHLRVGDLVRLENGIAGHVVSVTWQDVRIRTRANNLVVIPNRRMVKLIITNFHLPGKRTSLTVPVRVTDGPSPEVVEAILSDEMLKAARELPGVAPDTPTEVRTALSKGGKGSSFLLLCQVEDADLAEAVEQELLKRIAARFSKEKIQSPLLDSLADTGQSTLPARSSHDLRSLLDSKLKGATFVVASNREPYVHAFEGQSIRWASPPSGMTTAMDPVMRVLGGTWVAVASGSADREASDSQGRLSVPPDQPSYTLRRLWLTKAQEEGYYYGFSNRALWPMCHTVYIRPTFDASEWKSYQEVNRLFATTILEETRGKRAFVYLQDYHLALVPQLLKEAGANVPVAHFWHIPWPSSQVFHTCPWGEQILEGLLGNDLLGFHTRYDCNNFLETVDKMLECRVDYGRYSVTRKTHQTLVRPFPISVDFEAISQGVTSPPVERERVRLLRELAIPGGYIGLGVDRLDYTKGIPERLRAIDHFLDLYPEYQGRFTFIQVGVPSRSQIKEYRDVDIEIQQVVDEINWRRRVDSWQPILYLRRYFSNIPLWALYSMADVCIVSSLHDGMNLVAKEYVAARTDARGVLILSKFTGAAAELADALLVNPYDTEGFAHTIAQALRMPASEQSRRLQRMRAHLQENDIYRWAIRVLNELTRVEAPAAEMPVP